MVNAVDIFAIGTLSAILVIITMVSAAALFIVYEEQNEYFLTALVVLGLVSVGLGGPIGYMLADTIYHTYHRTKMPHPQ